MKLLIIFGLAFGVIVTLANRSTSAKRQNETQAVEQNANSLNVSLASNKRRYKRNERIKLQAMLVNVSNKDIFVYGILEWGHSASFTLYIQDAKRRDVESRVFDDALTFPVQANDTSLFVKLAPQHFLGTFYKSTIPDLNITKPGKYTLFVEYHSPIPVADVQLTSFWGKEKGTIKSNVVWIEVP